MREAWTGDVVAQMHIYSITQTELARQMSVTRPYINRLLTGSQKVPGAEARCRSAVAEIIRERRLAENAQNPAG